MTLIERLLQQVVASPKRIVLAEGEDIRTLKAAAELLAAKAVSEIFLLGDPVRIRENARREDLDISLANIISPAQSPDLEQYASAYSEIRKGHLTQDQAREILRDSLAFGCMLLKEGVVDAMVGGATHATEILIKDAFWIVGHPGTHHTISGFFIIESGTPSFGREGTLFFADCAVTAQPTPSQLADIAQDTARSFRQLTGTEPVVAFLSFSTKGSATHPDVDKVRAAVDELSKRSPGFVFDGEFQLDAAIVPSISIRKAPGNRIAGKANVLIFPDLDSGNIGYKIAERLGKARATGPFLQGFIKPVNDLSRGCSWQDIFNVAVVSQIQAGGGNV